MVKLFFIMLLGQLVVLRFINDVVSGVSFTVSNHNLSFYMFVKTYNPTYTYIIHYYIAKLRSGKRYKYI